MNDGEKLIHREQNSRPVKTHYRYKIQLLRRETHRINFNARERPPHRKLPEMRRLDLEMRRRHKDLRPKGEWPRDFGRHEHVLAIAQGGLVDGWDEMGMRIGGR